MHGSRSLGTALVALVVAVGAAGVAVWALTRSSHPKTLLIGDSLMAQTAPYVKSSANGSVSSDAIAGTGLLSRDQFDWLAAAKHLAATEHADIVVLLFVGNCREPAGLDPTHPVGCDTPAFYAQWQQAADQLTTDFEREGAHVYWVIPPPMRETVFEVRVEQLTRDYLGLALSHRNLGYVDGRRALGTATGGFVSAVPGSNGQPVPLRTPDGVHLSSLGAQRLAQAIVATTSIS